MTTTAFRLGAACAAATLVVSLGACATPRGGHPAGEPLGAPGSVPGSLVVGAHPDLPFPSCKEIPLPRGDASLYRDEPRYGNAPELTEAVHTWAGQHPGFEQLWLDRDHHGWIHAGFSGDVDIEALQAEVAQKFPGEGVVVVGLPRTLAELDALSDRVYAAVTDAGGVLSGFSLDVARGVLAIDALAPDPAALEALAAFEGEPICADVLPEESLVREGEQPTAGDGWRLLGHEEGVGEVYRTGLATNAAQLATLWDASGLPGAPGAVDWQREVVVWFGAVYGSSCPVRLDGVVVHGQTLHGDIVIPGWPGACNDDANPHAYVVAVERSLLPEGPFHVQLDADDPPWGAPEERTHVDTDLREPGSEAADAQVHHAPPIEEAEPEPEPAIEDGHEGEVPNGARYVWFERDGCERPVVGPFDGVLWRLADGEPAWEVLDGQETWLHPASEEVMVVTTGEMDYLFVPAATSPKTGCGAR